MKSLWILPFLSGLIGLTTWAAPTCEQVWQSPPAESVAVLPDSFVLAVSKVSALAYYDQDKTAFVNSLGDGSSFLGTLRELAEGKWPEDPAATLKTLKDVRRLAAVVRSSFVNLDRDHRAPERFYKFTVHLGHLNDQIEFDARKSARETASDLAAAFDIGEMREDLADFRPASGKSIVRQVDKSHREIKKILKKKHLSVVEFHEVRKLLKNDISLVQSQQKVANDPELARVSSYLNQLNEDLGAYRQEHLEGEVHRAENGHSVHPENEREKMPGHLRSRIQDYLDRVEIRTASSGSE